MADKIRAALARVTEALQRDDRLLARARKRAKKFRHRAQRNHTDAVRAQQEADALRVAGKRVEAEQKDRKAARCHHRAFKSHQKAIWWRGRIKVIVQRIAKLEADEYRLQAELRRLSETRIEGNVAKGGSPFSRWLAVQLASVKNCSTGVRRNFYSMSGRWNIDHPIIPGEAYNERSDCSQTLTAWAKAAGLPDPNGYDWKGGYTGTLQQGHNGWRQVSFAEMVRAKKPAFIIYGGGPGHHVEGWCPVVLLNGSVVNTRRTAGHGSAPVDFGTVDLFGDGNYRCFIYDPA